MPFPPYKTIQIDKNKITNIKPLDRETIVAYSGFSIETKKPDISTLIPKIKNEIEYILSIITELLKSSILSLEKNKLTIDDENTMHIKNIKIDDDNMVFNVILNIYLTAFVFSAP